MTNKHTTKESSHKGINFKHLNEVMKGVGSKNVLLNEVFSHINSATPEKQHRTVVVSCHCHRKSISILLLLFKLAAIMKVIVYLVSKLRLCVVNVATRLMR